MTELSQKILQDFQVRKSKRQKQAFIDLLKEHYPHLTVENGGLIKSNNIILGDVESSKIIFTAHYDTCARLPIPNFIAPQNPLITVGYSMLLMIPMMIFLFILNYPVSLITSSFWGHYAFTLVGAALCMYLMVAGPANKNNANDNTSGVIMLIEIYEQLTNEQRQQVAFVFFDNEELGLLGSSQFRKRHKEQMESKILVNFDCVSDGDHMLIAASKEALQKHGETIHAAFQPQGNKEFFVGKADKVYYPSDHVGFPLAIAIATFNKKKFVGYYMGRIHTKNDVIFDEANITLLADCTIRFLEKSIENSPVS